MSKHPGEDPVAEKPEKASPAQQALFDAIRQLLLDKYSKRGVLMLAEVMAEVQEKRYREGRETRYLTDESAETLKIIGTVPTGRFSKLLGDAFYTVLDDLEIAPEIEQYLDRELAPYERANGLHDERYYDLWSDLQQAIEPRIRAALLPVITLEGFGRLLQQISQQNLREADHIIRRAKRRRAQERGIKVVGPDHND